jgi:hypothetical protein
VRWYGVRCIFRVRGKPLYEERITLWRVSSFESAIEAAEEEARDYQTMAGSEYLGLAQAYQLSSKRVTTSSEVFSLVRSSALEPTEYVDHFFATGAELQKESRSLQ